MRNSADNQTKIDKIRIDISLWDEHLNIVKQGK
ncbi:hypothetical protein PG_0098 [Porphyromonas gingivalis W83]|uniref:Uncharacterized protein n=2 Tax=Porphyromonas gingivalis TaxID=837 RepID=Q7MXR5_PORGI|nr:hypothetical protein PG_0098 [Porphyromonas gingivalis W83]BAG34562.1 conserved hypothetical protein [Porphyromonas gingivalis ATCC 33277]